MTFPDPFEAPKAPDTDFNPFRLPRTAKARKVIEEIVGMIRVYESHFRVRKRERTAAARTQFERMATAVLADAIHRTLLKPGGWLMIPLSKKILGRKQNRYGSPVFGKTLPWLLDVLSSPELAFLEIRKGRKGVAGMGRGERSTIRATKYLLARIKDHSLELADLGEDPLQETIILKAPKKHRNDRGDWIDYQDDATTRAHREQLRAINEYLAQADIAVDSGNLSKPVDESARLLRRYFNNGSFGEGGRLFGGFWLDIKKDERLDAITIDGDGVAVLDFSQIGPRIAYSLLGLRAPEGDAYHVPMSAHVPHIPRWPREGVKKILNALLFANEPLTRMPAGTRKYLKRKSEKVGDVIAAIRERHPGLAPHFCTGLGFQVLFHESQIVLEAVSTLMSEGITALPVHDALIVPFDRKDRATDVMIAAARRAGVDAQVKEQQA